jgi:hypothetical protein
MIPSIVRNSSRANCQDEIITTFIDAEKGGKGPSNVCAAKVSSRAIAIKSEIRALPSLEFSSAQNESSGTALLSEFN